MKPATPATRLRWIVIGPFLAVVALLAGVGALSVDVLSAARAFVGGESLYSKGQKDALYHLGRYAETLDEADYRRFQASLALPLGDAEARRELESGNPDLERVRRAFLQGGNHPDDIDGLIRLYRRFRDVSFMADAIATWAEGDRAVAELAAMGERTHDLISTGRTGGGNLESALADLPTLNERLTELEARFSATLGAASRKSQAIVLTATVVLATTLALVGIGFTARILRRQEDAETALRESNERWQLAAAAAEIGIFDWDVRTDRVTLDARAAVLYGLPADSPRTIPASDMRRVVHPDDLVLLEARLRDTLLKGGMVETVFRLRLPDGRVRHVELSSRAQSRQAQRMVGILWDVTDDLAAGQLRIDKETAERANRAKTEFLSRVSHELRTPLNAVLGFAQLMQADRGHPLPPAQGARLKHVLSSGQHLLGLINDVLDVSSIDQGAFALNARDVDLIGLLRDCLARFEPQARAENVSLAHDFGTRHARVLTDPLRLEQVFVNLLSNAIKYNRAGGRVEVSLGARGSWHAVHVRDTGAGLTPQQIGQLFQPFNRLGAEYSSVGGSGLGLVISRQLVERMGGGLEVASEPGDGTTFTVLLPDPDAGMGTASSVEDSRTVPAS